MDENPYKAPEETSDRIGQLHPFLRLPTSVLDWLVMIALVATVIALLLPSVDQPPVKEVPGDSQSGE